MIFDTHAHYDDEAFDEDREELLGKMPIENIGRIVNVGASLESSKSSLALAKSYEYIFFAAGVHPSDTDKLNDENYKELEGLLREEKCVALGEIGLDYYWPEPDREIQKKWFERQLYTAKDYKNPIIIHSREAAQDTYEMIHCFSYSVEMARKYLNHGYYIGIGGVLTFKNAKKLKEVAEYVPLSNIVLETDCPYLSPEPNRGKRNVSTNLSYVVEALANIKGISKQEVEQITYDNACKLYRL